MVIQSKPGHIATTDTSGKESDTLMLQWFECSKRIMHKTTSKGRELSIKMLGERPEFKRGDILYIDSIIFIYIDIIPSEAIRFNMKENSEIAGFCYEIGNKHLPMFCEGDDLLVPYDSTNFRQLQAAGYPVERCEAVLENAFRTSVLPHGTAIASRSLLDRILKPGGND